MNRDNTLHDWQQDDEQPLFCELQGTAGRAEYNLLNAVEQASSLIDMHSFVLQQAKEDNLVLPVAY